MLENRYYAISIFSNEWWINNVVTFSVIFLLLFISKKIYANGRFQKLFLIFLFSIIIDYTINLESMVSIFNWTMES